MQDRESDTGYDTRRRALAGALDGVSQMRYTIDRGICDLLRVELNGDERGGPYRLDS